MFAVYIAAANSRSSVRDNVPNLLRPSPGLDGLSQDKLAFATDQAVDRCSQACSVISLCSVNLSPLSLVVALAHTLHASCLPVHFLTMQRQSIDSE